MPLNPFVKWLFNDHGGVDSHKGRPNTFLGAEVIVEILRGVDVPLMADRVLSPEVRYAPRAKGAITCLVFAISNEEEYVGRVTVEGFDAIRCCRGEYSPYNNVWVDPDYSQYPWVFEVDNSAWLQQRHEYEYGHYQTPLLEEYVHYFFQFHDEFVELIAKGIWLEKMKYDQVGAQTPDHPLMELADSLPAEDFVVAGIRCSVRHNPLAPEEMVERSKLCSQIAFQYFLTLDGQTKPSYAAKLRTLRGRSITRLHGSLFQEDLLTVEGIGQEPQARKAFERWVSEVAARRRQMGKLV